MINVNISVANQVDKFVAEYCIPHGIKILIDPDIRKDDGLCYPFDKEVHLGQKYSSQRVKLAILLHEIGHIFVERSKNRPYNAFECELLAWSQAIKLHKKYFKKAFTKTQAQVMLNCLQTYCQSQYEFKKMPQYNPDEDK